MDLLRSTKTVPNFGSANAAEDPKYHTVDGSNGNQYSMPDVSKNYNAKTGLEISDAQGAEANDSFAVEAFVTPAQRKLLIGYYRDGIPIFASRDLGKNTTTLAVAGYEYIMGKITDYKEATATGTLTVIIYYTIEDFN